MWVEGRAASSASSVRNWWLDFPADKGDTGRSIFVRYGEEIRITSWYKVVNIPLQGGTPPVMWTLGYNPHEYYTYNLLINPKVIGLMNAPTERDSELGHHLVGFQHVSTLRWVFTDFVHNHPRRGPSQVNPHGIPLNLQVSLVNIDVHPPKNPGES